MDDSLTIYVKDDEQKKELMKRYPNIKAEYINMEGGKEIDDLVPMVCMNKKGKEHCEVGEEYIEIFSEELKS